MTGRGAPPSRRQRQQTRRQREWSACTYWWSSSFGRAGLYYLAALPAVEASGLLGGHGAAEERDRAREHGIPFRGDVGAGRQERFIRRHPDPFEAAAVGHLKVGDGNARAVKRDRSDPVQLLAERMREEPRSFRDFRLVSLAGLLHADLHVAIEAPRDEHMVFSTPSGLRTRTR